MNLKTLTQEDEDRITKVDLAHEVERTREILHSCDGELATEIGKVKEYIQQKMTDLNDENRNLFLLETRRLKESVNAGFKEIMGLNETAIAQFRRELDKTISSNDKQLIAIKEFAEKSAEEKVDYYLAEIYSQLRTMEKKVDLFRKEILDSMTKSQGETKTKLNGALAQFDSIKAKFSDIAESLS